MKLNRGNRKRFVLERHHDAVVCEGRDPETPRQSRRERMQTVVTGNFESVGQAFENGPSSIRVLRRERDAA